MNPFLCQRGLLISLLLLFAFSARAAGLPMGHTLMPPSPIHSTHLHSGVLYGRVVTTMNSGGYTYVQLDAGHKKIWAAGPVTVVKPGDAVRISTSMPMRHFHSKTLKRDFALVYFTNTIVVAPGRHGKMATAMGAHEQMPHVQKQVALIGIKPAKHGKTIAAIFHERQHLAGKQVRVRGKVVQYIGNIYGKNWLHIRDSSSARDLLVITKDKNRADVILVKGTVALNKDNGIGHVYQVVLDNAHILGQ